MLHCIEEKGGSVLSSERFGDEFSERAEMGLAARADVDVLSVEVLYKQFGHYCYYELYFKL